MCTNDSARIETALSSVRVPAQPGEYDIHGMIETALIEHDIPFEHEHRLMPRCRIDFICGRIGIEVKKGRPDRRALAAQLERYLASDELDGIVVVMQRAVPLPGCIRGKTVRVVSLNMNWGIALP